MYREKLFAGGIVINKYKHQMISGISFGATSGVITALGMIVGLHEATSSKLAVFAGIVIMALADGLADAAGFHIVEEAELENGFAKHTPKEVWMSTFFTFLAQTDTRSYFPCSVGCHYFLSCRQDDCALD